MFRMLKYGGYNLKNVYHFHVHNCLLTCISYKMCRHVYKSYAYHISHALQQLFISYHNQTEKKNFIWPSYC